ncbi:hypothetical protein RND71_001601 [Anisodus tanguticus]|uniref:Uncharacterized protein n=1 Tax=Anisodus tanguticus TaxID=243964 RepID=A0AAE1SZM0_9SOLA|nr:hypothetical protein RND71_001601 [Anisodus tanguticus]
MNSTVVTFFGPACGAPRLIPRDTCHLSPAKLSARPGFQKPGDPPSNVKSCLEPIPLTEKGLLPADYVMEDPDSHFIYIWWEQVTGEGQGGKYFGSGSVEKFSRARMSDSLPDVLGVPRAFVLENWNLVSVLYLHLVQAYSQLTRMKGN